MSMVVNHSPHAIQTWLSRNNLTNRDNLWTHKEEQELTDYYNGCGDAYIDLNYITNKLNKTYASVTNKATALKLTNINRKENPKDKEKRSLKTKEAIKKHGHPKGMLGKTHTEENKKALSARTKGMWNDPNSIFNSEEFKQKQSDNASKSINKRINNGQFGKVRSRGKAGKRDDLGFYVRSSWEANYARYLNYIGAKYEFEPETHYFEKIKRGTRSYTPDFKIYNDDGTFEYHEVKGYLDAKSKTKLKRMAKYYPDIKIVLIGKDEYKKIEKQYKPLIPNWE